MGMGQEHVSQDAHSLHNIDKLGGCSCMVAAGEMRKGGGSGEGWVGEGGGEGFMSLKILPNRPIAHIRAWTPNFVGLGLPPELFFKGLHEDTAACCTAVGHANAIVR